MVEGDPQPGNDVRPTLGLLQVKLGPPSDDVFLVLKVVLQDLLQAQDLWSSVDNRQHIEVEGRLHQSHLVEVVQDDLGAGIPPDVDYNPHPVTVGFIIDIGDPVDLLVPGQFSNPLDQLSLIDHVRNLMDDNPLLTVLLFLNINLGPHDDRATTSLVGLTDPGFTHDDPTSWEVWSRQNLHQIFRGGIRVVHQHVDGTDDFTEVMGRNVGSHPDGNPGSTVNQQVWETCWQNVGFLFRTIVVRMEVHGVLINVTQHLHRDLTHLRLGITHGGRTITVD